MSKLIFTVIVVLSLSGYSEPIKSAVSAYQISHNDIEKESYSAKDYVQDGLVAMWDGIENAGFGEHDYDINSCVDLIGGKTLTGLVDYDSFEVTALKFLNNIDTSRDMTIECVWRDSGADRNCQVTTFTSAYAARYMVGDVRVGYPTYQIRYWNGNEQDFVYPMPKTVRCLAISYGDGEFRIYGEGIIVGSYDNATVTESTILSFTKGSAFNTIRIYSRTLSAEEVAYNHMIDKARFNLP